MQKTAIIGSGFIGRAWAISFARAGHRVGLWDQAEGAASAALAYIGAVLDDLHRNDLLHGQASADVLSRITPHQTVESALEGVVHVQENTPEILDVKIKVFKMLDRLSPEDAVIASSTSALLPSKFTAKLQGRHRCLVIHPLNPPYLIPAAEVVPAPWTAPETIARARSGKPRPPFQSGKRENGANQRPSFRQSMGAAISYEPGMSSGMTCALLQVRPPSSERYQTASQSSIPFVSALPMERSGFERS